MQEIIQLKISLTNSNPLIWRQIQVKSNTSFFDLHHIIQITMGWKNYHLFEFNLEGYRIGMVNEDERFEGYGSDELLDCRDVLLSDVITKPGETLNYLYDFGDYWEHQILFENFLPADTSTKVPVCTDGQLRCPHEDCGGLHGYYDSLEVLKNKKHPEYKETSIWYGRKFNPEQFDMEKVNRKLRRLKNYIKDWLG